MTPVYSKLKERLTYRKAIGFSKHLLMLAHRVFDRNQLVKAWKKRSFEKRRSRLLARWGTIGADDYRRFFERFGGSIHVHPDTLELMGELRGLTVDYRGYFKDGLLVAALPLWPEGIVGANSTLKLANQRSIMDVGDAELVLPIDSNSGVQIEIPGGGHMISSLHKDEIVGLVPCDLPYMLARGHVAGMRPMSKSTLSKHRGDLNRFVRAGGLVRRISEFQPIEVADMYRNAFYRQRSLLPLGSQSLEAVCKRLFHLMTGHVLILDDEVAAIQLLFATQTPHALLVNFVNGGVNPNVRDRLNPGSILSYLNIQQAENRSIELGLSMRYSFGWNDHEYKKSVADPHVVYRC